MSGTDTVYIVEGQRFDGKWDKWGCWHEDGRSLNPTHSIETARDLRDDLNDFIAKGKSGWRAARIVKLEQTRTVLND